MRLAAWRMGGASTFGLAGADGALFDMGVRSQGRWDQIGALIAAGALGEAERLAGGTPDANVADVELLAPIPEGAKIICVGVNYPERNEEFKDGSAPPAYPSLFVRFPGSFVGHRSPILRPPESVQFDYEGEIVLVIGRRGRRIAEADALAHVFGVTLMNEGSVRDWLRHGKFNVTQGKNFDRSGSIGPWIVPLREAGPADALDLVTRVNGEVRQRGNTGTLLFPISRLIAYISTFTTLEPGDLIATGTPPGAGGRFDPPRWLRPGDVVDVECLAIGTLTNPVADEQP